MRAVGLVKRLREKNQGACPCPVRPRLLVYYYGVTHIARPGSAMILNVQPDSPVPIYEQIVSQVIFGIASGALQVGSMIPSVRELAQQLLVHPNTVARAFVELERHGIVTARRGRGVEGTP